MQTLNQLVLKKIIEGETMKKVLILVPLLLLFTCCGQQEPTVVGKKTAETGALLVESYPAGLDVFAYSGSPSFPGQATQDQYLLGKTPLLAYLDAGYYTVTLKIEPSNYQLLNDGNDNIQFRMFEGENPPWRMEARIYHADIIKNHKSFITSFFFEDLNKFRDDLPDDVNYPLKGDGEAFFKRAFKIANIPSADWPSLIKMFKSSGKLLWYSPDEQNFLNICLYELEPEQKLSVSPIEVSDQLKNQPADQKQ
jgi:hypothetical protein